MAEKCRHILNAKGMECNEPAIKFFTSTLKISRTDNGIFESICYACCKKHSQKIYLDSYQVEITEEEYITIFVVEG